MAADPNDIPTVWLLAVRPWTFAHVEQFDGDDFQAVYAAEARLRALGVSIGAMQSEAPIAAFKGSGAYVSKWRGLSTKERRSMDAAIVGEKRNGPVWILFREVPDGR